MKPPSASRKLAFCFLIGVFSVLFVEVPAGSTKFPFFDPTSGFPFVNLWGLFAVLPLYLLHSVFFAALIFRFGKPNFWALFAAGMIYGMYEAYITKVDWVSFRPEGPFWRFGGIALFETVLLGFFLHPLLAFVAPLLVAEELCASSSEIGDGLPARFGNSLRRHPGRWLAGLVTMFGLMQFVNSPSWRVSFASAFTNCACLGLLVWWWRRSGGAAWSMRELLPRGRGCVAIAVLLGFLYALFGSGIHPENIPPVWPGQVFIWAIYAGLILLLALSVRQMDPASAPPPDTKPRRTFRFSWPAYLQISLLAVIVATLAKVFLAPFVAVQMLLFFSFYIVAGTLLLVGAIIHAFGQRPDAPAL
jgi:hypothetical protein